MLKGRGCRTGGENPVKAGKPQFDHETIRPPTFAFSTLLYRRLVRRGTARLLCCARPRRGQQLAYVFAFCATDWRRIAASMAKRDRSSASNLGRRAIVFEEHEVVRFWCVSQLSAVGSGQANRPGDIAREPAKHTRRDGVALNVIKAGDNSRQEHDSMTPGGQSPMCWRSPKILTHVLAITKNTNPLSHRTTTPFVYLCYTSLTCDGHHQKYECDTNFFVCLLVRCYRIDALPPAAGLVRTTSRFQEPVSAMRNEHSDKCAPTSPHCPACAQVMRLAPNNIAIWRPARSLHL